MKVTEKMLNDLPSQFRNKANWGILFGTYGKQFQQIYDMFQDIKNTNLENARGKNLDMEGDIVCLSRKDAYKLIRKSKETKIDDELYRKILKYKTLMNTCDCTYDDIMEGISILWDTNMVDYSEPEDKDATINLTLPEADIDGLDPSTGKILMIRPSGVSLEFNQTYITKSWNEQEKFRASCDSMRFWKLDGSVKLDGSKKIGPECKEEVLD